MASLLERQSIYAFTVDMAALKQLRTICEANRLPPERMGELQTLVVGVLKGEMELIRMPSVLTEKFGLDEAKSKILAADLAGFRLLPLSLYIPGIRHQIEEWGGIIEDYPTTIVPKEKVSPEKMVGDFIKRINLDIPEYLAKRLSFLAKGYLLGERDRDQTVILMKRPINVGGLELPDDQVFAFLKMLDVEKTNFEVTEMEMGVGHGEVGAKVEESKSPTVEEVAVGAASVARPEVEEPKVEPVVEAPKPVEKPKNMLSKKQIQEMMADDEEPVAPAVAIAPAKSVALTTSVPVIAGELIANHEKKEVEAQARKIARAGMSDEARKASEAEVNVLLKPVVEKFRKKKLTKKDFSDAATAHVKGLREIHQTEAMLRGKFGFSQEDADVIVEALEKARKAAQGGEKKSSEVTKPASDVAKHEQELMDRRHASLTKSIVPSPVAVGAPTGQVSAARTKQEEVTGQMKKVDPIKVQQAVIASRPEKAVAKITAASVPPKGAGEPIKDIKFVAKLAGPVEELGEMTPEQFRRLSSDPTEAVRKVQDKIDLLESTSYADRVRGIKAWRTSPISRLYMMMADEALKKGVSLAEIASARRNAGEESLSPSEIKAIVALNARIAF